MMTQWNGRVIEFFCGIGGFRIALIDALHDLDKNNKLHFISIDLDRVVSQTYNANFNDDKVQCKNIVALSNKDIEGAFIWTMSPPCQPFTTTRDAKQLDMEDNRNRGFMNLLEKLENIETKPQYIFFENVKGFINSETHRYFTETLKKCGYSWRQYLLNPMQYRIPNHRLRFYVCAVLSPANENFSQDHNIILQSTNPCTCPTINLFRGLDCKVITDLDHPLEKWHELGDGNCFGPAQVHRIGTMLDQVAPSVYETLDSKILSSSWSSSLSFVGVDDRCTNCFTSSYARRHNKSSGSLLNTSVVFGKLTNINESKSEIRFFSPEELLCLFGFPDWFHFPQSLSEREKYKCIGQSINVVVVRAAIHDMIHMLS